MLQFLYHIKKGENEMNDNVKLRNGDIAVFKQNETDEELPCILHGDDWNNEPIDVEKLEFAIDAQLIKVLRPKGYDVIYVNEKYANNKNKRGEK